MSIPGTLPAVLLWFVVIFSLAVPVVVLVFMVLLRDEIRKRLKQIEITYLGGKLVMGFGDASIDRPDQQRSLELKAESVAKAEQAKADSIKWDNSGNLFWVGHDLMLLIDKLLRGFPKDDILLTLQQCLHHVRELGFGKDHPIESKLNELLARADRTPSEDWTRELRDYYATELDPLKGALGDLASASQERRYGVYNPGPKSSELGIPLHE